MSDTLKLYDEPVVKPDPADEYIDASREVFAVEARSIYADALEEVVVPPPSIRFAETFPLMDFVTGGFRAHEFTVFCGPTGTGKTTLLANVVANVMETGAPQFVASVETGPKDFIKRVLSKYADIDLTTGDNFPIDTVLRADANHRRKLIDGKLFMSLYEDRGRIEDMMSDIAWHVKNKGVKLAWIDNLNFFMEVVSDVNAVVEMDRVVHSLIMFCKKVGVHIVMVMHPKKTSDGRVDSEFDIKGSSTAVQEAQNVLLWNRVHPAILEAGLAQPGDRELKIAKMRRRGMSAHSTLIMATDNGVRYYERELLDAGKYFETIRNHKAVRR